MFKKSKGYLPKQRQKRNTEQDNKQAFYNALHAVEELLSFNQDKDISLQVAVYDFSIKAIAHEISANSACQLFRGEHCPYSKDFRILPIMKGYKIESIQFAGYFVVAPVWKMIKWFGALKTVIKEGFRQSKGDYRGFFYEELKLIVITNGLHHSSIASLMGAGSAKVMFVRLADYFDKLTTDGAHWYFNDEIQGLVDDVGDYRIAVLYELAKRKHQLCKDAEFQLPHDAPIPHEANELFDDLLAAQNEKNYYRNECRLLKSENERLKEQLRKCCNNADI